MARLINPIIKWIKNHIINDDLPNIIQEKWRIKTILFNQIPMTKINPAKIKIKINKKIVWLIGMNLEQSPIKKKLFLIGIFGSNIASQMTNFLMIYCCCKMMSSIFNKKLILSLMKIFSMVDKITFTNIK
jgi:hypothetical protein